MSARDATEPDVAQQDTERSFDRLVEEGEQRLGRSWSGLISTGLLGGLDIGVGVLALLLVESITDSKLLGGLAFSIGFITLTLARSELFTEDFLVPIAAVATKASPPLALARLWGVTIATNLAGGWLITWIIIAGFPSLRATAVSSAAFYIHLGTTWRAFALALLGGFVITLMTHMQHATESDGVRLVPAALMGFLLGCPAEPCDRRLAAVLCGVSRRSALRLSRLAEPVRLRRARQYGRRHRAGHRSAPAPGAPQGDRPARRQPPAGRGVKVPAPSSPSHTVPLTSRVEDGGSTGPG